MRSSKLPRTIICHNGTFCCTVETYQIHFVSWKNYMLPLCHRWIRRAHWTMAYWFTIKFPHLAIILICNVPLAQLQKSNSFIRWGGRLTHNKNMPGGWPLTSTYASFVASYVMFLYRSITFFYLSGTEIRTCPTAGSICTATALLLRDMETNRSSS